jgi:hypothetical protein
VLGLAGIVWKYLDAEQQKGIAQGKEEEARKEADKARKASDLLVSIFRIQDIQAGNTTTARQILNQAEQRIPIEFAEQPQLRDELLAVIADVNRNLDRTIPAAMILEARGVIQLHSPRDSARPVPQALLYPDDRLSLAAAAQVQLVFLSDLHKERLQPGREATIGRKGCAPADVVRERAEDVLLGMFVSLLPGPADQRPVLRAGELQRPLSGRQGTEGAVPGADDTGGGLSLEQAWVVRHASIRSVQETRTGWTGAAAGTPSAEIAGRPSATGASRATGTAPWVSAWPAFPVRYPVQQAGANTRAARSGGQRAKSERGTSGDGGPRSTTGKR